MKTIKLIPVKLAKLISPMYSIVIGIITLLTAVVLFSGTTATITLKVMKMGLGSGTVTSSNGINCGGTCDVNFASGTSVTFTAAADAGSVFVRWEGDVTGTANPATVTLNTDASVRAVFDLATPIPALTDFTPTGIQTYLDANPIVNTPARFVKALPAGYKLNWILMTRSESLQTGTAEFPRLLLPSLDAKSVFTIGMVTHGSYPGSDPNAIEYMQWDPAEKNFRFHEIILAPIPPRGTVPARTRMVSVDDSKCSKCHSTNNVLNLSSFPGTTGIPPGTVKYKNKPNWDAYDSWGGMMPLNRDRIYQGSVEAAAFRKIFNLWTWSTNDPVRSIIEQLQLQPPGVPAAHVITRTVGGANDGHINFVFDASPPVFTEPAPTGSVAPITTNYTFNNLVSGVATSVVRGGTFITLHHSNIAASDEGRGVRFFDALGGLAGTLNQQRIADELISHRFATGSVPIDIRPIALAISRGLVVLNASKTAIISTTPGLSVNLTFFDSRNGTTINNLYNDTKTRAESLPRRKADIQKINLDRSADNYLATGAPANGLIQQYGAATSAGTSVALSRVRQDVFRRNIDFGNPDATVMSGIYVDRELYASNTEKIALFRYFLGPMGVSVDKWSMGVRGRSRTYTFADVFDTYFNVFEPVLKASLLSNPVSGLTDPDNDAQLITAINNTLSTLPGAADVPKFTDVQRIFNKSCIECHGGLNYPPYSNFGTYLDFSEDENPPAGDKRLDRSHTIATSMATGLASPLYQRITAISENCPFGLMPCGGPALCKTDIETIRRWIGGTNPYTVGDPHIRTVNGVQYDFQAAGEFVLLRGENIEIQARHTPVETNAPLGPNGHTGLTSCVSVNSAFAIKIGSHRVTYQPNINGKPDPSGLQLRVNGKLVQLSAQGISLAYDGRIMPTSAPGGMQINAPGGTVIVITPGWWDHYKLWFLNIDTRQVRATEGLMGAIAPGNWLPALPNGTLMGLRPQDLNQRYKDLYGAFGNAWRVNDTTSLFDYAPGTSTRSFITENWPGGDSLQNCKLPRQNGDQQPLKPMDRVVAGRLAAGVIDADRRANLIEDLMATGDSVFAKTYLLADKINRNKLPDVPVLVYPNDFDTVTNIPVKFTWNNTTDKDGDPLTYKLYVWPVNERPDLNNAVLVSSAKTGWWSGGLKCALLVGLIGLLVFIILYFMGLKKKTGLLILLALAILAAAIAAYFFCGKAGASNFKEVSSGLQPGKAYFWKVITEDGQGGIVESETRRIQIK
jgi:Divergent InlB B-repeat domain